MGTEGLLGGPPSTLPPPPGHRPVHRPFLLTFVGLVAGVGCDGDPPPGGPPPGPDAVPPAAAATPSGADTLAVLIAPDADSAELPWDTGDATLPPPVPVRGAVGSCDLRATEGVCYAFTGLGWTTEAAQSECSMAPGGVFQSARCPTAERIGECVYRPGEDAARELVYTFYTPVDPLIAEGVCRGTFRAF